VSTFSALDLDAILSPISPQQPAGDFDDEDNAYQGIESEMMKLGGLQCVAPWMPASRTAAGTPRWR